MTGNSTTNEIWLPLVGAEGYYEVSNMGRVKRVRAHHGMYAGAIIKPGPTLKGYLQVGLSVANKHHTVKLHSVVACAFLGPRPDGLVVNHKDGDKNNNSVGNLEYVTHQDNIKHAVSMGLTCSGDRHRSRTKPETVLRGVQLKQAKLTEQEVVAMRKRHESGDVSFTALGKEFGVTRKAASAIIYRKCWKHI